MAEAFIQKVSRTVEKESQQVQENVPVAVEKVKESVEGVADEGGKVKEKVAETKKSIASLVSHGFTNAEGLVHAAKDYVDHKGTDLHGKIGQLSDSRGSLNKTVPGGSAEEKSEEADQLPLSGDSSSLPPTDATDSAEKSEDADQLPVSGDSSSLPPTDATDRGLPENQPLLSVTRQTQTSWTNCCGLLDCFTSSDR